MRILVDATSVLLRSAGVKNFVYYWLLHLRQEAPPGVVSAFPFLQDLGHLDHLQSTRGKWSTLARLAYVNFTNIRGNRALDVLPGARCDLFHASQHLLNPPRKPKLTATIFDMTCWLMPEMHTAGNVTATRRYAERILRRADGIIAISECARRDAARILGLREEAIEVIYPGVAPAFFQTTPADVARLRATFGLAKPYGLFIGCIEPRKNVATVLDAWSLLPASLRAEHELIVAGPLGWNSGSLAARLSRGGTGVRYLGYVAEKDLPALTAGAAVFLYPSFYEGFGFPVAQALAAGAPIVTSKVSSLPEITGDAALLIDPRCADEIRNALEQILLSPSLAQRLRARGIERAQRYQWAACARQSLAFFHRVAGAGL